MKWIICFRPALNIGIWKLFTLHRPDFQHVYAVRYDPELKIWITFEFASQRFNFEWCSGDEAAYLVGDLFENHKCIEIEASEGKPIFTPRFMYCVSFVKHIVGINNPFILTPYQLYCELIKKGGKPIFESIEGDSAGIYEAKDIHAAA